MDLHVLAYSDDLGQIRRLVIEDNRRLVAVISCAMEWRLPSSEADDWRPYLFAHNAVGKEGFNWLIEPDFDQSGFVTNALAISDTELHKTINWLSSALNKGLLPASSTEDIKTYLGQTHSAPSKLSDEQRRAALKRAREARKARAELKRQLKEGSVSLRELLGRQDDPVVGRLKIRVLVESLPGVGKAGAAKKLADLKIDPEKRVHSLKDKQRSRLGAMYGKR